MSAAVSVFKLSA